MLAACPRPLPRAWARHPRRGLGHGTRHGLGHGTCRGLGHGSRRGMLPRFAAAPGRSYNPVERHDHRGARGVPAQDGKLVFRYTCIDGLVGMAKRSAALQPHQMFNMRAPRLRRGLGMPPIKSTVTEL